MVVGVQEEKDFTKRLERFVKLREATATKPFEDVLEAFAQNNEHKLDTVLAELKEEMKVLKESAAKSNNDEILKAIAKVQVSSVGEGSSRSKRMNQLASSPTRPEPCSKCTEREVRIVSLEKELAEERAQQRPAGRSAPGKVDPEAVKEAVREVEAAAEAKYAELEGKMGESQEQVRMLKAEVAKLMKQLKVEGGVSLQSPDEVREDLERLSLEASLMDAAHPDGGASHRRGRGQGGQEVLDVELEEAHALIAAEVGETIDGVLEDFGLSEQQLMDVMERVEGLQGGAKGPIAILRDRVGELEAHLREAVDEAQRSKEHAERVEVLNQQHVTSLAKIGALEKELQQAKDHSEHMEFLSQQYADQVRVPRKPIPQSKRLAPAWLCIPFAGGWHAFHAQPPPWRMQRTLSSLAHPSSSDGHASHAPCLRASMGQHHARRDLHLTPVSCAPPQVNSMHVTLRELREDLSAEVRGREEERSSVKAQIMAASSDGSSRVASFVKQTGSETTRSERCGGVTLPAPRECFAILGC